MKDKKSFIWLTLGFAALIATIWIGKPERSLPSENPREVPAAVTSSVRPAKLQEKKAKLAAPAASRFTEAPADEEELKKLIPFKVKDRIAIAYGDVMLGEIDPGSGLENGYYQPEPVQLWNEREIPYAIDPRLPNPNRVEEAIRYLQRNTRLVFVPFQGQEDAMVFEPGTEHCLSYLGKTGGHQPIRLADDCGQNEILHEVLHALGFIHEHSRPDRDEYVEVVWDNIDDNFREQFAKVPTGLSDPSRGTPFDFKSIMLYPPNLFGKQRGQITLKSRSGEAIRPAENALSEGDLQRIRDTYR